MTRSATRRNHSLSASAQGVVVHDSLKVALDKHVTHILNYKRDSEGHLTPRYRLLSHVAKRTPFYVFNNEDFANRMHCKTAFTDGAYVFVYAGFLRDMITEDKKTGTHNTVFLLLHELSHIAFQHSTRIRGPGIDSSLANIAMDVSINTKLRAGFDLRTGDVLADGYGMAKGDIERYIEYSEEALYKLFKADGPPNKDRPDSNGETTGPSSEQGSTQSTQSDSGAPSSIEEGVDIKDPIAVRKALEDSGLHHVAEALKLPATPEEVAQRNALQQARLVDDVQKIRNERLHKPGLPGQHIDSYAMELIDQLHAPKMTWLSAIRNAVYGDGMQYSYANEEPGDLFYYDSTDMGFSDGDSVYIGQMIPAKNDAQLLAMIDTSASVNKEMLRLFLSEIFGIVQDQQNAVDVRVVAADTMARGDPIEITPYNWADFIDGVQLGGGGGTDFATSLSAAKTLCSNDNRMRHILYFTDLGDQPPVDPECGVPVTFVVPEHFKSENFAKAVSPWASVVEILEGECIDLAKPLPHGPSLS